MAGGGPETRRPHADSRGHRGLQPDGRPPHPAPDRPRLARRLGEPDMLRKKMITRVLAAGGFALGAALTFSGQADATEVQAVQADADSLEADLAALDQDITELPPAADPVPAPNDTGPPAQVQPDKSGSSNGQETSTVPVGEPLAP